MSIKKQSLKTMLNIFMKHQSGGTIHAHQAKIKLNSAQLGLWKRLWGSGFCHQQRLCEKLADSLYVKELVIYFTVSIK